MCDIYRVIGKRRQLQIPRDQAADIRVRAQAQGSRRNQFSQIGGQAPLRGKQFLWLIAFQPRFKRHDMFGRDVGEGNLMAAPVSFHLLSIDALRACPPLRRAQDDHRPDRAADGRAGCALGAGRGPDGSDFIQATVQRGSHPLMHVGIVIHIGADFHKVRVIAVATEEALQFFMWEAREHCRIGDLVAVQVQYGQHAAVIERMQELVRMPTRRQWAGFRLAVADDAGHCQIRIIEGCAKGVRERIAEFAAFVHRSWNFRGHMRGNATWKRELLEQSAHAVGTLIHLRVDLAIAAFEPGICHDTGATVAGADDVAHAKLACLDDAVQMNIDEVQARRGTPVAEQAWLDVLAA